MNELQKIEGSKEIEGKQEIKLKCIELIAKGFTYDDIAKELEISKGTITNWNKVYQKEIKKRKVIELEDLFNAYYLTKEARIKKLGTILNKLEEEAEKRDLTKISDGKLFELVLKYRETLKDEVFPLNETEIDINLNGENILNELYKLHEKVKNGDITKDQAYKENYILMSMLKAYEATTIEKKLDAILAAIDKK